MPDHAFIVFESSKMNAVSTIPLNTDEQGAGLSVGKVSSESTRAL